MTKIDSEFKLFTVTTAAGAPLNQFRDGSLSAHRSTTSATSASRTTRPSRSARTTMSRSSCAVYSRYRPRMMSSSLSVFNRPPVASMFAARTAAVTCGIVNPSSISASSRNRISISSSGNPLNAICEMPSTERSSCSISRASRFSTRRSSTPVMANVKATPTASCLNTMGGSIPTGKLAMRSTAFFTSWRISSVSRASSTSMVMLPTFSLQTDLTWSNPAIPCRFSSILATMPSSISSGEAPG